MGDEKIAPVQGYSAGIPWSMHLRAYDAYCKKWGSQKALIDLEGRNCRGGFSTEELNEYVPGWRISSRTRVSGGCQQDSVTRGDRTMGEIKRYAMGLNVEEIYAKEVETQGGYWVAYADHAAALAEYELAIKNTRQMHADALRANQELADALAAARQEIERLRELLSRMSKYMSCQEGGDEYPTKGCGCKECVFMREVRAALSGDAAPRQEHRDIDDLVRRFSEALRQKLYASEEKYGWRGRWKDVGWRPTLLHAIRQHVEKGDPRDVAAYCAFAWHHGWSLEALPDAAPRQAEAKGDGTIPFLWA